MVAFAHRAGCANNGPDGEATAKGYEGFFAKPAPYFVDGVFVVEVGIFVKRGREGCAVWTPERHGGRSVRMQVAEVSRRWVQLGQFQINSSRAIKTSSEFAI